MKVISIPEAETEPLNIVPVPPNELKIVFFLNETVCLYSCEFAVTIKLFPASAATVKVFSTIKSAAVEPEPGIIGVRDVLPSLAVRF